MSGKGDSICEVMMDAVLARRIRDGLARITEAETAAEAARNHLRAKMGERDADEQAAKALALSASPDDEAALLQGVKLEMKLKLWPRRLSELQAALEKAEGLIPEAKAALRGVLGEAAGQIVEARRAFVRRLLEPLKDAAYVEHVIGEAPLITEAIRFQGLCTEGMEQQLGMTLDDVSAAICSGQVPPLPAAPDLRLQAGTILASMGR